MHNQCTVPNTPTHWMRVTNEIWLYEGNVEWSKKAEKEQGDEVRRQEEAAAEYVRKWGEVVGKEAGDVKLRRKRISSLSYDQGASNWDEPKKGRYLRWMQFMQHTCNTCARNMPLAFSKPGYIVYCGWLSNTDRIRSMLFVCVPHTAERCMWPRTFSMIIRLFFDSSIVQQAYTDNVW